MNFISTRSLNLSSSHLARMSPVIAKVMVMMIIAFRISDFSIDD